MYNPSIGKFLSVDPLATDYPWYTHYQFAGNKPIQAIDLDGLEEFEVTGKGGKGTVSGPFTSQEKAQKAADAGNSNITYSPETVQAQKTTNNSNLTFANNPVTPIYNGVLRGQYAVRGQASKKLWLSNNPKNWQIGFKNRFDAKTQTRKGMFMTPSLRYAMNNAHDVSKYKIFKSAATDRFKISPYNLSDPTVQARIGKTGKPPRFYRSSGFWNGAGGAGLALGAYGAYESYQNISTAKNKINQTKIELGTWGSSILGAELFGGAAASIFPHPYFVGGASLFGGIVGGIGGRSVLNSIIGDDKDEQK